MLTAGMLAFVLAAILVLATGYQALNKRKSLVDKYFSRQDQDAITSAVADAEKVTNIEMKPLIFGRARNWLKGRVWAMIICASLGFVIGCVWFTKTGWGTFVVWENVLFLTLLCAFFGWWPGFLFFVMNEHEITKAVEKRTQQAFSDHVKGRTAVSVVIALFLEERRVRVMPQKEIKDTFPQSKWVSIVDIVRGHILEHRHAEGMIHAIEAVADLLKEKFPPLPGDVNELGNAPVIEDP